MPKAYSFVCIPVTDGAAATVATGFTSAPCFESFSMVALAVTTSPLSSLTLARIWASPSAVPSVPASTPVIPASSANVFVNASDWALCSV